MVSMPHGPVLSRTLDLMKGAAPSAPNGWSRYVCRVNQHAVTLADGVSWDTFLVKTQPAVDQLGDRRSLERGTVR